MPIETAQINESGCLGAAFLAGLGIGRYSSAGDIISLTGASRTFEPRSAVSCQYDDAYETYKELVARIEGLEL